MRSAVIVDDHPGFRAQARKLLEQAGYRVRGEAADGLSALRLTSLLKPDLVMLDVQLPGMNGFDVARRLATDATRAIDVVIVSGREATTYGALIDECGAKGFIWKGDLSVHSLGALLGRPVE
jgi:DNA-binding NarL/FixJ family response regulator